MSIADTLIKRILADQIMFVRSEDALPPDAAPVDDLLPLEVYRDAPDIEIFLTREPDSGEGFIEMPDDWSMLGTYRHMASPGRITLYRRNIEAYWKSLLRDAHRQFPFITTKDAERVLSLLTQSVYQHERFHYICDFSRQLLGGSFDRWHEEGLAVAHEWHWQKGLGWNSVAGLMHPTLRRIVTQRMFDHHSKGYKDWRHYAQLAHFHAAVASYLFPNIPLALSETSFNCGAWLVAHGADEGNKAWEEQIN